MGKFISSRIWEQVVYASPYTEGCMFRQGMRACGYIGCLEGLGLRVCPPPISRPHPAARPPRARCSSRTMGICERWYFGEEFIRCCIREHVIFAGPCVEGSRFRQGVRICRFTGLLCGAAVRSVAWSCAPTFLSVCKDRFTVKRELGEIIVLRSWC